VLPGCRLKAVLVVQVLLVIGVLGPTCIDSIGLPGDPNPVWEPNSSDPNQGAEGTLIYKDPNFSVAARVSDLLARMTLAEKIGQMLQVYKESIRGPDIATLGVGNLASGGGGVPQNNSPEGWAEMVTGFQRLALQSRLGIPMLYGVDAVHGHSSVKGATIFPHNAGLGATRDPDLVERIGRITAIEMIATGVHWAFAPTVAVPQDIRWGRTHESYSENTGVVSVLGSAFIRGLQNPGSASGPGAGATVLATPKHFVGDGGTAWGTAPFSWLYPLRLDHGDARVDETTLRAVHLPPYAAALEAGAMTVMVSYSSWRGVPMHANKYLLTDVLKGEMGFTGLLVSDCAGIDGIPGPAYTDIVTSINAGVDVLLEPDDYRGTIFRLALAVTMGHVAMERIDDAVRRILTAKFQLGLFEKPFGDQTLLPLVGSSRYREVAREAVRKSLVLLKNENETLPLSKTAPLIYVAGQGADDIGIQCGGWTIEWQGKPGPITSGTTILEGIRDTVSAGTSVVYNRSGNFDSAANEDRPPFVADVGIAVVGEMPYAEGFGDRSDLNLSDDDVALIDRVRTQCRKLVVILISGRPMIVTEELPKCDALVAAWLPGTEAQGVADVLFGDYPFTGKLPYTWPRSMDQVPLSQPLSQEPPLFPFGYGLNR
jgi:beta-glucosidase